MPRKQDSIRFFGCCMLRTLMVNVLHCHTFRFYNAAWPSRPKHFILRKSHIDRTLMRGLETTLYIDCQILILFLPVVLFDFAALVSNPTTCCDNCLFFLLSPYLSPLDHHNIGCFLLFLVCFLFVVVVAVVDAQVEMCGWSRPRSGLGTAPARAYAAAARDYEEANRKSGSPHPIMVNNGGLYTWKVTTIFNSSPQ